MRQHVPLPPDQHLASALHCNGPVILFGAGIFAPTTIHSLRQFGIVPVCICDNSTNKHGMEIMGIHVDSPEAAHESYPKATIVITAAPKYIQEIRSQAERVGWSGIFDCACLLAAFDYGKDTFETGVSALHYDLDRYFYEYCLLHYPELLVIPSIDIVITEKCSLKCRDCANLMQFYAHPKNIDFAVLFSALDELMKCVDHVLEFRVLGGEAFMNPLAHQYITELHKYTNYSRIAVYSNGTIVPKKENLQCLINDDTYLRISDYGSLSVNMTKIKAVFDAEKITYDIQSVDKWQDCAEIGDRNRTREELETIYTCCCANKTFTLLNTRLYVCPFSANASNIGALPSFPQDHLEISGCQDPREIREKLFDLLRNTKFISACKYCAGRPIDNYPIPAAVQISSPRTYKKQDTKKG